MALATSLRKVATKLMAKFGGDVTIRIVAPRLYNTTTGSIVEVATDVAIKGVLEDVSVREVNELVQAGDKRLMIAAADVTAAPTTTDCVVINSISHQVIRVDIIEQDNTAITYELLLRA